MDTAILVGAATVAFAGGCLTGAFWRGLTSTLPSPPPLPIADPPARAPIPPYLSGLKHAAAGLSVDDRVNLICELLDGLPEAQRTNVYWASMPEIERLVGVTAPSAHEIAGMVRGLPTAGQAEAVRRAFWGLAPPEQEAVVEALRGDFWRILEETGQLRDAIDEACEEMPENGRRVVLMRIYQRLSEDSKRTLQHAFADRIPEAEHPREVTVRVALQPSEHMSPERAATLARMLIHEVRIQNYDDVITVEEPEVRVRGQRAIEL